MKNERKGFKFYNCAWKKNGQKVKEPMTDLLKKNSEWLKKNFILPTDNESSSKSVGQSKTNFNELVPKEPK